MFIYGNIEELNHEQHNDHLRRIEYARLVREVEGADTVPGFCMRFYHTVQNRVRSIQAAAKTVQLPERIGSPPTGVNRG
jgi:hypothetical protein